MPAATALRDPLDLSRALREIARRLTLRGDRFRARAYSRAADMFEESGPELLRLAAKGRLTEKPGIGAGLAAVITELFETGRSSRLERLRQEDEGAHASLDEPPPDLVDLADVQGAVHCHTVASDGNATLLQMARAAEARGFKYLTVTDHSPTAYYAHGLDAARLKAQWDEIAQVQENVGIRLLRGTECDITRDGALDWPDDVLAKLDVVIASIHNRYKLGEAAMTERVLRAIRHPAFKIWGHPLGRLIDKRPPIPCDIEKILDACAVSRVAIELNGDPRRLDLPPELVPAARERGIPFVLGTDAHSTAELDNAGHAVFIARKGGIRRTEVLNVFDADSFAARVRPFGKGSSVGKD
jgi:DNA polymerase (family X)